MGTTEGMQILLCNVGYLFPKSDRYIYVYIWSILDSKIKDKPSLQSFNFNSGPANDALTFEIL